MNWLNAPKMYIAGPYSGDVTANVHKAWLAGREIAQWGYIPVIPHTMTAHMEDILTPNDWYAITLELLKLCDAIYMLKGWELSRGAVEELDYAANTMKIHVYYQGSKEPEALR